MVITEGDFNITSNTKCNERSMHLYVQLIDDIDVIAVADKMLFGTGIGM